MGVEQLSPVYASECSFVIQGPITISNGENVTQRLIDGIRSNYPESEIVLSTWSSPERVINTTKTIFSKDPGVIEGVKSKFFQNLNRQIVSTKVGLLSSTRKYSFKIRSDFYFINQVDLFDIINRLLTTTHKKPTIFNQPVIMSFQTPSIDIYSLPDWLNFGQTIDLLKIWDISLATVSDEFSHNGYQLSPEQYITLNMLKINSSQYDKVFSLNNILFRHDLNFLKRELLYVSRHSLGYQSHRHPIKYSSIDERIAKCINNNHCLGVKFYFLLKMIKVKLKIWQQMAS